MSMRWIGAELTRWGCSLALETHWHPKVVMICVDAGLSRRSLSRARDI